ncbi:MAG: hypothetical protein H7345_18240 [Rubritepida sp.]|nr:hypothetical protein [Rubritepida sp.]
MRRVMIAIVALLPGLAAAQPASSPPAAGASASRPVRAAAAPTATATTSAPARAPSSAQLAQRQRMRDCSTEARSRNLGGAPRPAFMRPCLGGNPPVAGAAN